MKGKENKFTEEGLWTSKELWDKVKEENKDKRSMPIYPPIYYDLEKILRGETLE